MLMMPFFDWNVWLCYRARLMLFTIILCIVKSSSSIFCFFLPKGKIYGVSLSLDEGSQPKILTAFSSMMLLDMLSSSSLSPLFCYAFQQVQFYLLPSRQLSISVWRDVASVECWLHVHLSKVLCFKSNN